MAAIDRVVLNVIKKFEHRADVGLKKYGVTLEREDLNTLDWINEAQQEAMDFCLYLERLRMEAEKQKQAMMDFAKHCLDKALDLDIRTAHSQVENYYNNEFNQQKDVD